MIKDEDLSPKLRLAANEARALGIPESEVQKGLRATQLFAPWGAAFAKANGGDLCTPTVMITLGALFADLEAGGLSADDLSNALKRGKAINDAKRTSGGRA